MTIDWLEGAATESRAARFRRLIAQPAALAAPGAFDGMSALLARKAGFEALYLSGAALSASMALPDLGLLTLEDVWRKAREIIRASDLPLIVDCDTGFGEALNIMRAVREFEEIGAACIQIEDQQFPKKCGHLNDKRLVSVEDMCRKVAAARRAAKDLVICARTDAAALSLDDAIMRANRYVEAGADLIFVEALTTPEHCRRVRAEISAPLLANMTEFGRTPQTSRAAVGGVRLQRRHLPGIVVPRRLAGGAGILSLARRTGRCERIPSADDAAIRALRHHPVLRLRKARRLNRADRTRRTLSCRHKKIFQRETR